MNFADLINIPNVNTFVGYKLLVISSYSQFLQWDLPMCELMKMQILNFETYCIFKSNLFKFKSKLKEYQQIVRRSTNLLNRKSRKKRYQLCIFSLCIHFVLLFFKYYCQSSQLTHLFKFIS